ncbi:hypothetical protein CspeluHIS016_0114060 [Cutaneotrichosporon spelunceum]|uniref:Oxidase FUB9 n=1 Tax=Cutaneotrichosporon spelunceum TaxID=1672016 RepID=A0AAD3TR31_9TREE|nr:hypothetical protein CspeluHIS016_0114060 [Cutaneotrichosporon spelunceum]
MNRLQCHDPRVVCIADLQREATKKLGKVYGEYYNEGSMDLITLNDNVAAFDRVRLRPRVCIDVSAVDMSTECFGTRVSMPLGFSPAAFQAMAHPIGEIGTSRAAAKARVNMVLSTYATASVADVTAQGRGNAYGMQLSMVVDWDANLHIVRNAERAGCRALVLTVDSACLGRRLNEYRNEFCIPATLPLPNLPPGVDVHNPVASSDPRSSYDNAFTWDKVKRLAASTSMPIYLKGILTAEDAILAANAGATGVIVSNHGGRQLDGALATFDALEGVANAVKGRIEVHFDGGIRRGSDVFKAIALGADYCWVGRVPIWGLAYNGEAGVSLALGILRDELLITMSLCGCRTLKDIRRSHLARMQADGTWAALADFRRCELTVLRENEHVAKL